ncbi:MAG: lytic murein transglycosylase, partial [Rhodanobacteraceae bacterium]
IETIPYHETRDYVSRVLAFSVVYDWRLNGKVVPLAARMPPIGQRYHPPTPGTARKDVSCVAAADAAPGADLR